MIVLLLQRRESVYLYSVIIGNGEINPDFCLTLAGEGDREFTVQVCRDCGAPWTRERRESKPWGHAEERSRASALREVRRSDELSQRHKNKSNEFAQSCKFTQWGNHGFT